MSETTGPDTNPAAAGCLLRLFWMLAGNAAIYMSLATIVANRPPLPSYLDAIVGATLLLMLAGRHADITRFGGRTMGGDPATLRDWRRYVITLVGTTALAWALAHLIAGSFAR